MMARRPGQSGREKLEQMRRADESRSRRRRGLLVAAAALALAALGIGATVAVRSASDKVVTGLAGVQSFTEERGHIEGPVAYPQSPPAGGRHDPVWLNCGIYPAPVRNENAVHDLEHGAVWITYRPDLSKSEVGDLTKFATGQTYLVLSPYPGLPVPVVVSAWGKQLRLTGVRDPRLREFVKAYKQGPQTPEPGASCSGGVGAPG